MIVEVEEGITEPAKYRSGYKSVRNKIYIKLENLLDIICTTKFIVSNN